MSNCTNQFTFFPKAFFKGNKEKLLIGENIIHCRYDYV